MGNSTVDQEQFDAAIDEILSRSSTGDAVMMALGKRFPDLRRDEFDGLILRAMARLRLRAEREKRETEAMTAVMAVVGDVPASMSIRAAIALRASEGDVAALALQAQFNSPTYRLNAALIRATVAAHPDWSEIAEGTYTYLPATDCDPPEIPVDWFIDTFPEAASSIHEAVTEQRPPGVPQARRGIAGEA